MDRWQSQVVNCKGGLVLDQDILTQGIQFPGSATYLDNYEPSTQGGYRRVKGYTKFTEFDPVDADALNTTPITGVGVGFNGFFATRKLRLSNDNAIFYSDADSLSFTQISSAARAGTVEKSYFLFYSISEPVVIQTDGVNHAWKSDSGFTDVEISGTGAPADPKFAALWRNRLALSGYSANLSAVSLSAPNDDEDFDGANGAIEINVGDVVTGLRTFRDELYVFCENSIHKLTGTVSSNMTITNVTTRIGCVSHATIQEIGGDLIFMSNDGIRTISATERIGDIELGLMSRAIQPLIETIFALELPAYAYSSCAIRSKSQYRFFYFQEGEDDENQLGLLSRITDAPSTPHGIMEWATLKGFPPYSTDSNYITTTNLGGDIITKEYAIFGHPTNGNIYILEDGYQHDTTDYVSIYETPVLIFEDATVRKVLQKLKLFTQEGSDDITLNITLDQSASAFPPNPTAITIPMGGSGEDPPTILNVNLIGTCYVAQLEFSSTSTGANSHRIDSFQIQYALKGRR